MIYPQRSGNGSAEDGRCKGISGRDGCPNAGSAGRIDPLRAASATDLPVQTPEYARMFNVIDSFDTHAKNPGTF